MERRSIFNRCMYRHTPLKEPFRQIRLLNLHPGEWKDDIACDIHVYDLSNAPRYQAISYTWGDGRPDPFLQMKEMVSSVTWNCDYALRQARLHRKRDCLIWVDTICIDQKNIGEKSSQVSIMGDIYQKADSVLACLGNATKESDFLYDHVERMAAIRRAQPSCHGCCICGQDSGERQFVKYYRHTGYEWASAVEGVEIKRVEDAYYRFAQRRYWSRVWIVQEILLAQESYLLCGERLLQTSDFLFAMEIVEEVGSLNAPGQEHNPLAQLAAQKGTPFKRRDIPSFMVTYRALLQKQEHLSFVIDDFHRLCDLQCTDSRDRIYGLLKVIRWPDFCGPPKPDYRISPCELLIDVVVRLGRQWQFPEDLFWMSWGLGLGVEALTEEAYSVLRKLVQDHSGKMFDSDSSKLYLERCRCDLPALPRTAILKNISRYGVVYDDGKGALFVTLHTQNTPDAHTRLALHRDEECNHCPHTMVGPGCPKVTNDLNDLDCNPGSLFWMNVQLQDGDFLAEIDGPQGPLDPGRSFPQGPRLCLVLRDAGNDYYSIRGRAEIYGNTQWCPGRGCRSDPQDSRHFSSKERCGAQFMLCIDASDAVLYVLGRREVLPGISKFAGNQSEFGNLSFTHRRFSSYAIKVTDGRLPIEIQRVPTTNHQRIICAGCGGQFDPETSITKFEGQCEHEVNKEVMNSALHVSKMLKLKCRIKDLAR